MDNAAVSNDEDEEEEAANDGDAAPVANPSAAMVKVRTPWVDPKHPGKPTGVEVGESTPAMQRADRINNHQLAAYVTQCTVDTAIVSLIKKAAPEHSWKLAATTKTGVNKLSVHKIMQHLKKIYGKMKRQDKANNLLKLHTPWDHTTEDIEIVLLRGKECQLLLRHDKPMNDNTLIDNLLGVITNIIQLSNAIHEWDDKPEDQQNMEHFVAHFIKADQERRTNTTTAGAGYHAANNVAPPAKAPPANRRGSSNRTPANSAAPKPYCHTHGIPTSSNHFSINCKNPGHNHNYAATFTNRMGGSEEIQQLNPNNPKQQNRNNNGNGNRNSNKNSNRNNNNSNGNRNNNNNNNNNSNNNNRGTTTTTTREPITETITNRPTTTTTTITTTLVGWKISSSAEVGLRVMCPSEAHAPRNVTMYLNYHYVCKLPAAGVVVAIKSSSSTRTRGELVWNGTRGTAHVARQGIWNGGKDVVWFCLVLEGRRVIIWEIGWRWVVLVGRRESDLYGDPKGSLDHRGDMWYEVFTSGVQFCSPECPGITLGSLVLG